MARPTEYSLRWFDEWTKHAEQAARKGRNDQDVVAYTVGGAVSGAVWGRAGKATTKTEWPARWVNSVCRVCFSGQGGGASLSISKG